MGSVGGTSYTVIQLSFLMKSIYCQLKLDLPEKDLALLQTVMEVGMEAANGNFEYAYNLS